MKNIMFENKGKKTCMPEKEAMEIAYALNNGDPEWSYSVKTCPDGKSACVGVSDENGTFIGYL